jgi:hypothetical protein
MSLYDSDKVILLRNILEGPWERLTFDQRTQAPKALRILRLGRRGERDPMRLRAGAIDE